MVQLIVGLIAGFVVMTSSLTAGVVTQIKDNLTLKIRFDAETQTLALSDLLTIELLAEGSAAMRVEVAKDAPPGWTLVERTEPVRETIAPNRVRWRLLQRFAPHEPGPKVPFAFPAVKIHDGDKEQSVTFSPVDFNVTTQITKLDLSQLQGTTEIETLPAIAPPDHSWRWWAALAVVLLLAMVSALLARRWLTRTTPRTPGQLAMREWQRLIAMKLPEKGKSERFVTLLTIVLRRYLERQFALPARRQTTPEFLRSLAEMPALTADEKQFLASFLQRCEAVKFARTDIDSDECDQWAQAVWHFLTLPDCGCKEGV